MTKIAVIGAGIGGLGAAHYLRQDVQEAEITIYEKQKRVGGRVLSYDVDGFTVEVGAVYFHSLNQLINSLVDDLDLPKETMKRQPIGLWNTEEFEFKQGKYELWNNIKLLFRFGFTLTKLLSLVSSIIDKVELFYQNNILFPTMEDLLASVEFAEIARRPFGEVLLERGLSQKLIDELVIPTTRYVYHHSGGKKMNGFAGLVSMIAYDNSPVYYVPGGNTQICQAIADSFGDDILLDTPVRKITKTGDGYKVETEKGSASYDIVILACPQSIAQIELENIDTSISSDVVYKGYHKTIVVGEVDPEYFNQKKVSDIPPMLLTYPTDAFPIYGFELLGETDSGYPIYEITSTKELKASLVDEMFVSVEEHKDYSLPYSFPDLTPPESYDPIMIADNFYYLSAIDQIAPTLELSLLMARNIVNLINNRL